MPNRWFMRQRLSPDGTIAVSARSRALEGLRATDSFDEAPGTWVNVGPKNIGGRVTALGVDPNDPLHLWLGTADGGVWTSSDEGATWTPVFDDQGTLSIGALATHPTDSDTVYVGTGEDNGGGFSFDGEGIFKTTDGGASWSNLGLAEVRRVGRIAIDPSDPDRVFVAAGGDWFNKDIHRGIYRSTDGGQSWSNFAAIWQRYSFGTGWYVGGVNSAIWRSLDGGDTWTKLATGLPSGSNVGRIGLAIAPSNPSVVFAVIIDDPGVLIGVYRSLDGGDTWVKRNGPLLPQFLSSYGYYFGQIRVDPDSETTVYLLDLSIWRSTNGGGPWTPVSGSIHVDQHDLIVEPGDRILTGNDGGFYRSPDNTSSWIHSVDLPITQFYDLCIDNLDTDRRFGGTQDNGTNRTVTGGDSDWTNVLGGDGMQCEVDYTDSNKVYAESQFGNIARSTDGGDSFVSATSGIDPAERANWVTPITLDPVTPSTLYTGFQKVYRSVDSAVSWTAISPDLTNGPGHGIDVSGDPDWRTQQNHLENLIEGTITVVNISPVDTDVIWAGTDDGNVWVTDDAGANWGQVNPPGLSLWVTDVAPDPFDADTAYLTVTGYREGDRLPYIRTTADLGQSWTDITSNLPQVPLNAVVADPSAQARLLVASDLGVHVSNNGGVSWSMMSGGIPALVVLDLVIHDASRTLYAGTHARSIYTYDLGQLPPPDRDADGVNDPDDCAPDDGGAFADPAEVGLLSVSKAATDVALFSWPSLATQAGTATVYDVAVGDLADLAIAGGTGGSSDLNCALGVTGTSDPTLPTSGDGLFYMVRGRNVCALGTWGDATVGGARDSAACP
jgi:photosystem II stability/assembly factor-like uncharacterized protein